MKLYQLLRHLCNAVPVRILDIAGICICQVQTKEYILKELYDYNVLSITIVSLINGPSLCIMLEK